MINAVMGALAMYYVLANGRLDYIKSACIEAQELDIPSERLEDESTVSRPSDNTLEDEEVARESARESAIAAVTQSESDDSKIVIAEATPETEIEEQLEEEAASSLEGAGEEILELEDLDQLGEYLYSQSADPTPSVRPGLSLLYTSEKRRRSSGGSCARPVSACAPHPAVTYVYSRLRPLRSRPRHFTSDLWPPHGTPFSQACSYVGAHIQKLNGVRPASYPQQYP